MSSYKQVCATIQQDLGQSPEALFRRFDREPLASASLAQARALDTIKRC